MRDGVPVTVDVFRPVGEAPVPALLGISPYGKEMQTLPLPPQPYWSPVYHRGIEAGDPAYLTGHGYAHVIADSRGTGSSGGEYRGWMSAQEADDGYDLVEWIATRALVRRKRRDGRRLLLRDDPAARGRDAAPAPEGDHADERARRLLPRGNPPRRDPPDVLLAAVQHDRGPPGLDQRGGARPGGARPPRRRARRVGAPPLPPALQRAREPGPPPRLAGRGPASRGRPVLLGALRLHALRQDQDPELLLVGLVGLRAHAPARRVPELQRDRGAEEALHRGHVGDRGADARGVQRRGRPLVRLLAEGHRQRDHGRAADPALRDGREPLALRARMAARARRAGPSCTSGAGAHSPRGPSRRPTSPTGSSSSRSTRPRRSPRSPTRPRR